MSFHPSVKAWTYDQFVERYKDQLTEDEIKYFATSLGLVSEPAAGIVPAPVTPSTITLNNVLTAEEMKGLEDSVKGATMSISRQAKKLAKSKDKTKTEGGE